MSCLRKNMQERLNSVYERVDAKVLLAASIAGLLAAESVVKIEGIVNVPSDAVASLVGGLNGTASVSSAPATIVYVTNTTIGGTVPAWYGQLPLAASTVFAPEWSVMRSSPPVDLSFWRPLLR